MAHTPPPPLAFLELFLGPCLCAVGLFVCQKKQSCFALTFQKTLTMEVLFHQSTGILLYRTSCPRGNSLLGFSWCTWIPSCSLVTQCKASDSFNGTVAAALRGEQLGIQRKSANWSQFYKRWIKKADGGAFDKIVTQPFPAPSTLTLIPLAKMIK